MDPDAYERYLVPVLFRPLAEASLAAARPVTGRRVLDVACGTGIVARLAAGEAAAVTGVDLNPALLALARKLEPRAAWLRGDAAALPLPDHTYEVAVCQQGLQFVAEPAVALRELRRVLVPGGRLVLALWADIARAPGFDAFATVLDAHGGPGGVMRAPFGRGDAGAVRALLDAAGFTEVRVATRVVAARFPSARAFFERQVAASPLAGPLAALPVAAHEAMIRELSTLLAERVDDAGLSFPAESHLFTATA